MELLTSEIEKSLPELYAQEGAEDAIAYVKYFTPWSYWTWYVTEYDGNGLFFGLVQGDFEELGYFSLGELKSIQGPFGLKVERDLHFIPSTLTTLREKTV